MFSSSFPVPSPTPGFYNDPAPESNSPSLNTVPEELIERILFFALSQASASTSTTTSATSSPPPAHAPRTSLLLISRALNRIGTPLLYTDLRICSSRSARLLARTLSPDCRPELAFYIRTIYTRASYASLGDVFRACRGRTLESLDITVDAPLDADVGVELGSAGAATVGHGGGRREVGGEKDAASGMMFGAGLRELDVQSLVLRKRGCYLTQPRPKAVMQSIAKAILKWKKLETATIAFRLSDSRRWSPPAHLQALPAIPHMPNLVPPMPIPAPIPAAAAASPPSSSSSSSITIPHALSLSPNLRTLRAALPAVWNTGLLQISTNPSLQRIVLTTARPRSPRTTSGLAAATDTGRRRGKLGMGLGLLRAERAAAEAEASGSSGSSSSGSDTEVDITPGFMFAAGSRSSTLGSSSNATAENTNATVEEEVEMEEEVLKWGSGIHLWMMEARKYPRLVELIKAGSPGIRTRAHTLDTVGSSSPLPSASRLTFGSEGNVSSLTVVV